MPNGPLRESSRTENAHSLLAELRELGIHVELVRGRTTKGRALIDFNIDDPKGAMTEELNARVQANRARVIDHLKLLAQGGRVIEERP